MNQNFDLNIDNYTLKELEDFFGLNYDNYNEADLLKQESKLKLNILNDKNVGLSTKTNTFQFLSAVRQRLINHIKNISSNIYAFDKNLDRGLDKSDVINVGSTNIIKQSSTPYSTSFPSEFYQGSINPLFKRILRQNVNIDTRFRSNYYATNASNFNVELPLKISQVVSLQLSALEMPNTFYVISQVFGNNFFVLEISGLTPLIVTIPDGNYDYLSLQEYINNYLQTVGTGNYQNIRFLSDINTPLGTGPAAGSGRMVAGSTTGTIAFSLNFVTDRYGNEDRQTPLPLKLGWLMGFREGYYENALTYVSEGIINLLGPRYIYLVVDDFNNNVNDGFYAAFSSSILNKNILARISLQGSVFNLMSKDNFNLITTPRQYFGPVDIQKLQIQLLDEYGRILNLNNMDYSFCLTFQTIYEL
jgi:hypothetical protein